MAILSKDKWLESLKARVGDDTSDETLQFIQDMTDTYNDLEAKASNNINYEQKYKDNDAMWRKKYRDAFFNGKADKAEQQLNKPQTEIEAEDESKDLTYESLFTVKE